MTGYDLSKLTTFKIGCKCEEVYFPATIEEFTELLRTKKSSIIIAGGSNLLISSNGINSSVISTSKLKNLEINGNKIKAECGVKGGVLAQSVAKLGLSGFEFLIAFPGTVGGNIFMNASAHGQFMSDCFVSANLFDKTSGEIISLSKEEMNFGYKKSILQTGRYILLDAEFELIKKSVEEITALMDRNLANRKQTQPSMAYPNAGCVFKNPENDSAGRLLDKAGMKGFELENVKVWDTHANFIVNKGNATSTDVLELMLKM